MVEINWIGESLDTIVSLSGKYGRWLNARGKKLCFLIWTGCAIYWLGRDLYLHLYSQSFFMLVSIAMHLYGYYNWKKKGFGEEKK